MGRINFGPKLLDDRKGITDRVTLGGATVSGWTMFKLPLKEPRRGPICANHGEAPKRAIADRSV